jgi:hypothetical protein
MIFGLIVPIAAAIGYFLASPTEIDSLMMLVLILGAMSIPWVLRWHHPMLVLAWNASITFPFLPGSPYLWMCLAVTSFGLTMVNRIMDKGLRFPSVPTVTWSLIAFAVVVFITAKYTGGWGFRSLGSSTYGGKKYFFVWLAIIGYFAMSWRRIPVGKAEFLTSGYFLSGITASLSNLVYVAGPSAWILYFFIPVDWAVNQALEDFTMGPLSPKFSRLSGLAVAGMAAFPFILMRYGVRGILDITKPWRLIATLTVIVVSLLGGFRSAVVTYALLFAIQFVNEGLLRTRLFPVLAMACVGLLALSLPFMQLADRLPMSIQRSLSVIPFLPVSSAARADAKDSTDWRLQIWALVAPEIPRYFWFGKGFTASSTEHYLVQESIRRGYSRDYELMILAGDYHNGPLSLLIPFGIWGVLAFAWFVIASWRLLYRNYRYGDPALQRINTLLYSFFISKIVFFLFVFGAISTDIASFVGVVALSISLNGGMCAKPEPVKQTEPEEPRVLRPALGV